MDDLISRQAFKEECLKAGFFPAQIAAVLKRTPAVDAVEVVRCKDCKRSGMYCFGIETTERLGCLEIEEDGFVRFATAVNENDFCSRGERKENG